MASARATLVTICREPLPVTLRFLAWHREVGFDQIHLHLDDPDDPVLGWIADKPWVQPVRCTPDFWRMAGIDPGATFTLRQVLAYTQAYRRITEGWVAVADADELFHFGGQGVAAALAALTPEVQSLRIGTAEYIGTVKGRLRFRLPMTKAEASHVYGRDGGLFRLSGGLIGHSAGKAITRAGLPIRRMRPHWAVPAGAALVTELRPASPQMALLHLSTSGHDDWRRKLDWRLGAMGGTSARVRRAVQQAFDSEDRDLALRRLYDRLFTLNGPRLRRLDGLNRFMQVRDDLLAITRRHFPDAPPMTEPVAGAFPAV